MSASNKKKLRKEQNAAALTERQKQELKEAKKLKAYTVTFVVVMVLVLSIVVGIFVRTPIAGAISRGTHAANIGSNSLSTNDLSYFYADAISNHYNTYYSSYGEDYAYLYAQMMEGIDFTKPVGDQVKDKENGQTWGEYYIEEALKNAQQTYALYEKAVSENFQLDEENQEYLDGLEDYMELYASYSGASSVASYLRARYGIGANMKTFEEYTRVSLIASEYYAAHQDSLEYTDEDYREYEAEKKQEYDSYTYATYTITASKYLTGGTVTKDEDGKETTTYTDEEKQASIDAAKADAEALIASSNNSVAALNAAIAALAINKDAKEAPTATEYKDYLYSRISNEDIQKWLSESTRADGDITFIENSSTSTDEDGKEVKTVTGYTVILSIQRSENLMKLQNVRHILVKFTGGTTDETTGSTTYSDAEKEKAKTSAQEILDQYLAGEKTEAAFEKLAKEKTEDTGSKETGGLYEDIYPGQMVTAFNDWCFDTARQPGDTGLVETEYGYHVMYYVSTDEMTYRDYMIDIDMTNEEMEQWTEELAEKLAIEKIKLTGLDTDYILLAS